ncbi:Cyclin domain-containing protein [Geosmithia morbida]|uniref:Cyclin domain-containing protein n=1 Tax=Geosmithia morbida TaxID=1094350 RepID=A0A9P5D7F5_9HYPO|nr:Cyclin domain-containing protein [Geosmithia morbida]KAF4126586.1 Cyclin domain-containing protein [Geosmithia morbida]
MAHLVNPLATPAQLLNRSTLWSMPQDLQDVVFSSTQCLTQAAGLLLELPQSVTAQACVVLARYWLIESPMATEFSDISAAALYVVAKMGPIPRSLRDVSNVYAYLTSHKSKRLLFAGRDQDQTADDAGDDFYQTESEYYDFQKRLLRLEVRIMRALSFDTHVSLPHALAMTYLQTLDFLSGDDDDKESKDGKRWRRAVSLRTVQHLNTALVSPQMLYLTHQPHALATAAVYCAARDLSAKMPQCPWWEVFDVDREELGFLVVALRSVEGILVKARGDMPSLVDGDVVTRSKVRSELASRGGGGGGGGGGTGDDEDDVMRIMDSR